jgi:hypothetical protein
MVALQKDRPGFFHVAVNLATRRLVALDVVRDLHAVQNTGDAITDDGGLDGLPLARRLRGELVGAFEAINRPDGSDARIVAVIVAQDLDLVPAPQIEPPVGVLGGMYL